MEPVAEATGIVAVLLFASINVFGGLIFGYNMGIIANAQNAIEKEYNLDEIEVGILTSSLLLGAMIGSLSGGTLADKIGRKKAMIINATLAVLSTGGLAASPIFIVICIVRAILGISVGLSSVICPLYVSEMAPAKHRGILGSLFQLFITFGIVVAYIVGYVIENSSLSTDLQWRIMFLGGIIFPLSLFVISVFFMKESPFWKSKPIEDEPLLAKSKAEGGWKELFSRRKIKPLLLGVDLAVALSLTGVNAIMFYAPVIFGLAGFDKETPMTLYLGIWNFVSTLLAVGIVDRLGRKPLLVGGLVLVVIGDIFVGFAFMSLSGETMGYVASISLAVFIFGYAVGPGATFWVLINEIFTRDVRDQAASFVNVLQWGINLLLATVFRLMLSKLGEPACFWFFGSVGLVTTIYTTFALSETKGKDINASDMD